MTNCAPFQNLIASGFKWIEEYLSLREFDLLCAGLGITVMKTDIEWQPEGSRSIHSSRYIPMHSEPRAARFVAWYCEREAATGGETILLDARKLIARLPSLTLDALEVIPVELPNSGFSSDEREPLLTHVHGAPSLYYIRWLVRVNTREQGLAVEQLA